MTTRKEKAIAALLTCHTQAQAAQAAGISRETLRNYLNDDEFQAEYQKAVAGVIEGATRQAQQTLSPALSCLRDIVEDSNENSQVRVSAARSLLEYGLKLTEFCDIVRQLEGGG